MRYLRTPLDLPLLLFLASAFVGYWASFEPETSAPKLILIIAAIGLYYILVAMRRTPALVRVALWVFLAVESAFVFYYLGNGDFASHPTKFAPLTQIGIIFNRLIPRLPVQPPHPNMVAFSLEIGLPFAVALAAHAAITRRWVSSIPACAIALWLAFGLVMTTSRGALLAYGFVGSTALLIWAAQRLSSAIHLSRSVRIPITIIVVAIGVLILVRAANLPDLLNSVGSLDVSGSALSRAELYSQTWALIQEYYFTGAGLGAFALNLSAYALLIEVPFLGHAHNLYLAVWIEQGIFGFIALLWAIAEFYVWAWGNRSRFNWLTWAGVFATSVWLVHGFVDTPLYASRALPLMFVPAGFAIASVGLPARRARTPGRRLQGLSKSRIAVAVLVASLLVLGLALGWKDIGAVWEANLGSVAQERIELGAYQANDRITEIRRGADLSAAEEHFDTALSLNPLNPVANFRLGLIRLSRGEFEQAVSYLEQAWLVDPNHHATRKALGYAYTWLGDLAKAEVLLRSVREAPTEMDIYSWWWQTQGEPVLAERAAQLVRKLQKSQ